MTPEEHINEIRQAIRLDITRELMRQISECEKQIVLKESTIIRLQHEIEALRLDLAFFENSYKAKDHVKPV
jgi:hypothetical protein